MSAAATTTPPRERPTWARDLEPYSNPTWSRSLLDIATSVVPYLALLVAVYIVFDSRSGSRSRSRSRPPASCCAPSSSSTTAPTARSCPTGRPTTGSAGLRGLLVFQPFENWRTDHGVHHGTAGDLDRRGNGDVPTLTLDEYYSKPAKGASATASSATPS